MIHHNLRCGGFNENVLNLTRKTIFFSEKKAADIISGCHSFNISKL